MDIKDLDLSRITVDELLKKFGAGSHIPGSGSAMAFQGMMACQLILTVIDLTCHPKRYKKYNSVIPEFHRIKSQIETKIYPKIKDIFLEDSIQFNKVIINREKRDKLKDELLEVNVGEYRLLAEDAINELVYSTELILNLAGILSDLTKLAFYVFDNGFKTVRGDSGTSVSSIIAAIDGCVLIAELNLQSIEDPESFEDLEIWIDKVKADYDKLYSKSRITFKTLRIEAKSKKDRKDKLNNLLQKVPSEKSLNEKEIDKIVKELQNWLWGENQKNNLNILEVINPEFALRKVGYNIFNKPSLGIFDDMDGRYETAGIINQKEKIVLISDKFQREIKTFTLAHELGHAILHRSHIVLHRDRGLAFGLEKNKRTDIEWQADKFAAYFLMPEKEVRKKFKEKYETNELVLDENSAFFLNGKGLEEFKKQMPDLIDFARFISKNTYFNGMSFNSLAEEFGVSREAMAIRIIELSLLKN